MTFDDDFPENSAMSVAFESRVACDAAEQCAAIIFMESKLPPESRNLTGVPQDVPGGL